MLSVRVLRLAGYRSRAPGATRCRGLQSTGGLERDVPVRERRRKVGGRAGDDFGAQLADGRRDPGDVQERAFCCRGAVDLGLVVLGVRPRRARPGRSRRPPQRCAAGRAAEAPQAARGRTPGESIEVASTTSEWCEVTDRTSAGTAPQSVSISSGSIVAIVSTSRASRSAPVAPWTRPRTRWSKITTSTRSPARVARADSSSVDSNAVSIRGSRSIRAADVRPLSMMTTTRRSRSGRHVRTTRLGPPCIGSVRRAVARQSIERTSSPRTYSRRLSNSVPWPRTMTLVRPSSSRSRARREGRCLRALNGGSTRIAPAADSDAWRAASPSGPNDRIVTAADRRSPRRNGVSSVVRLRRSPGGRVERMPGHLGARGRLPCVAHDAPDGSCAAIGDVKDGGHRLAEAYPGGQVAGDAHLARRGRQRQVKRRQRSHETDPGEEHPGLGEQHDGHHSKGEQRDESTGECHGRGP